MIRCLLLALLCGGCAVSAGCVPPAASHASILPPRTVDEVPAANLPRSLRPHNWTDARGSGSCVHASTVYSLFWCGKPSTAQWWRKSHAGGETANTIRRYHDAAGLKYFYTLNADPRLLDWATQTRRAAIIWYYPRHCVSFVGFHAGTDGRAMAHLVDNNRPSEVIRIERSKFLREWAGYGGFALALADPPVPPPLYDAVQRPPQS